jgi:hypothetical protein
MTNLSNKNCGLCSYFGIKENRYLDRFFDHYCTRGEKEKLLGDDSFRADQNVCKYFLKKINLDNWSKYPWSVVKNGINNVVIWNNKTEETKVFSKEDALSFIRKLETGK